MKFHAPEDERNDALLRFVPDGAHKCILAPSSLATDMHRESGYLARMRQNTA